MTLVSFQVLSSPMGDLGSAMMKGSPLGARSRSRAHNVPSGGDEALRGPTHTRRSAGITCGALSFSSSSVITSVAVPVAGGTPAPASKRFEAQNRALNFNYFLL